jgi:hypothetical protein
MARNDRVNLLVSIVLPQRTSPLHGDITRDLLHPGLIRGKRDSCNVHPAALKMDEKQHVVGHQTAQREHLCGEEVGSRRQRQVGPNEDRPRGRALALRRGWQAVPSLRSPSAEVL